MTPLSSSSAHCFMFSNGIFIHAIIVGKTNEWPQFYPLKEFTEKNPRLFDGLGNLILER